MLNVGSASNKLRGLLIQILAGKAFRLLFKHREESSKGKGKGEMGRHQARHGGGLNFFIR